MIVECPQCHSQFKIDASLLTEQGRDVRCTQCTFVWKQKPHIEDIQPKTEDAAEIAFNEEDEVEAVPEETAEPVPASVKIEPEDDAMSISDDVELEKKTALKNAAIVLAILCLLALGFVLVAKETIMRAIPGTVILYDAIGMYDGHPYSGFKIEKTLSEIRRDSDGRYLYVEADITNVSGVKKPYPPIKIMVLEDGVLLKDWYLEERDEILDVGQTETISVGLPNVPDEAVITVITIEKKVKDD